MRFIDSSDLPQRLRRAGRGKEALTPFFRRFNDDYHKRVKKTDYHSGLHFLARTGRAYIWCCWRSARLLLTTFSVEQLLDRVLKVLF